MKNMTKTRWEAILEEGRRIMANYDKAHPTAPLVPKT